MRIERDGVVYELHEDGTAIVTGYNTQKITAVVTIPSMVEHDGREYVVTEIRSSAFNNCTSLKEITIPDSVTRIGDDAFYDCTNLKEIVIPDNVTEIGNYAFLGCSSLREITIPDSVRRIGDAAFNGCDSLTEIIIPDSVTKIGSWAFCDCATLTTVTIPDSVLQIEDSAFGGCKSLTAVNLPDSVTWIKDSAFQGCTSLNKITIPDSVTEIGCCAFCGCTNLTEITIPNSVTEIRFGAFKGCSSLREITIPDSVRRIGDSAFKGCTSLTKIKLPDSPTTIENWAFAACINLKNIWMPKVLPNIERYAFIGCSTEYFTGPLAAEQAAKMGQYSLAQVIDETFRSNKDTWQQSLPELLGVKGSQLHFVVSDTARPGSALELLKDQDTRFRLLQRMQKNGAPIDETAFYRLYGNVGCEIVSLMQAYAKAKTNANHFLNTLLKRSIEEQRNLVGKYRDYLRMKRSMHSNAPEVLKVSNIVHEHAAMVREYNRHVEVKKYNENPTLLRSFTNVVHDRAYQNALYGDSRFIVRAPEHPADLVTEGRLLSHCVGSYVNAVANGTSKIHFLRYAKTPDEPYCTVELKGDTDHLRMTQCYNAHDKHDGNPERIAFIHEWAEARNIDIQCAV